MFKMWHVSIILSLVSRYRRATAVFVSRASSHLSFSLYNFSARWTTFHISSLFSNVTLSSPRPSATRRSSAIRREWYFSTRHGIAGTKWRWFKMRPKWVFRHNKFLKRTADLLEMALDHDSSSNLPMREWIHGCGRGNGDGVSSCRSSMQQK